MKYQLIIRYVGRYLLLDAHRCGDVLSITDASRRNLVAYIKVGSLFTYLQYNIAQLGIEIVSR